MRRTLLASLSVLLMGASLLTAVPDRAQAQPAPYAPIPPPQQEMVPPPPGTRYVWVPGHWHWNGYRYNWIRGEYVIRRAGWSHYVPGEWVLRPGGWVWVPAHWR